MRDDLASVTSGAASGFYDSFARSDKSNTVTAPDSPARSGRRLGGLASAVLTSLAVDREACDDAERRARLNGTDIGWELVCAGEVGEDVLAEALGKALGIAVGVIGDADRIVGGSAASLQPTDATLRIRRALRVCGEDLDGKLFIAPRLEDLGAIEAMLRQDPLRRSRLRLVPLRALRNHQAAASEGQRSEAARLSLAGTSPEFSARTVLSGGQGFVAGMVVLGCLGLMLTRGQILLYLMHLIALPIFLCYALARLASAFHLLRRARSPGDAAVTPLLSIAPRPVYSVLVPLHDEAEMVDDLVTALSALRWPASRLEVMLVCEGDDLSTAAAVRAAIADKPHFTLVLVAPSLPRTKPKALNVALPLANGEYVVIYDAEDRPHPLQLEAAFQRFRASDARLACLQAPLIIRNGANSWLSGHFALEYAALFRGFLPWLSTAGLPLPLGGTSNHFRLSTLQAIGGWDSHNVTEDADLGVRLYRHGFRVETIGLPTVEDAPERWSVWRNQRTRWMKGWIQTWLVHMRSPVTLLHDLGAIGFLGFQMLFLGMVASSVAHALLLVFLLGTVLAIWSAGQPDMITSGLLAADIFNLVAGYVAFIILSTQALDATEKRSLPRRLWTLPFYWLLISLASLRAFAQLFANPHGWEKTPHGARARARPVAGGLLPVGEDGAGQNGGDGRIHEPRPPNIRGMRFAQN